MIDYSLWIRYHISYIIHYTSYITYVSYIIRGISRYIIYTWISVTCNRRGACLKKYQHWQTCKNMIAVTYSQLSSNFSLLVFWNSYPSHTIQSFKRPRCAWIPDENNHSNTGGPLGNFSERFGQWKVGTGGSLCGMVIRKNDDQSVISLTHLTSLYKCKKRHLEKFHTSSALKSFFSVPRRWGVLGVWATSPASLGNNSCQHPGCYASKHIGNCVMLYIFSVSKFIWAKHGKAASSSKFQPSNKNSTLGEWSLKCATQYS